MNINDRRKMIQKVDVIPPPVVSEETVYPIDLSQGRMVAMGPVERTSTKVSEATVLPAEDADEEVDPESSFELEPEDMTVVMNAYTFIDHVFQGVLKAEVRMKQELVQEMEIALGELHSLINDFVEFRPEDAELPALATAFQAAVEKDV